MFAFPVPYSNAYSQTYCHKQYKVYEYVTNGIYPGTIYYGVIEPPKYPVEGGK